MSDEGTQLLMAEYIKQEKELKEKIRKVELQMQEPLAKLRKAKEVLDKAKAYFDKCLQDVRPLQSEKTLAEGELELVLENKRKIRIESRLAEGGGIRPGTQQFVEQMQQLAGDPGQYEAAQAAKQMKVEDELAALKQKMGD